MSRLKNIVNTKNEEFYMTAPLIFVDPIVNDSASFIERLPQLLPEKQFLDGLGIKKWQVWIQGGPRQFCIQYIESKDPKTVISAFKGNPRTQELNALFLTHLSQNSYWANPSGKINQVLDLVIDPNSQGVSYDLCYMLPLLSGNVEAHKEYCRLAMNEKREQTVAACLAFKMIDLKKWIQETPEGDYVLYRQRMKEPVNVAREAFLALKDNPKALQATLTLREQTGSSFEELFPQLICIEVK